MKKLFGLLSILVITLLATELPAYSLERTFNSPNLTYRKLAKQFLGSTAIFTTTDPSPEGTPLTLTSATGVVGPNGTVSIVFGAVVEPTVLTVYTWQPDGAFWARLGAASTEYAKTLDQDYVSTLFSAPEGTPFLVMSDVGIVDFAYTDAKAHPSNANTAP